MILTSPVLLPALATATAMLVGVRASRQQTARRAPLQAARRDRVRQVLARRAALANLMDGVERQRQAVFTADIPRNLRLLQSLEGFSLREVCSTELPMLTEAGRRRLRLAGRIPLACRAWLRGGAVPQVLLGQPLPRSVQAALSGRTLPLSESDERILRRLLVQINALMTTLLAERDQLTRQQRHSTRLQRDLKLALQVGRDCRRMARYPLPGQARSTWQLIRDHAHATQSLLTLSSVP